MLFHKHLGYGHITSPLLLLAYSFDIRKIYLYHAYKPTRKQSDLIPSYLCSPVRFFLKVQFSGNFTHENPDQYIPITMPATLLVLI